MTQNIYDFTVKDIEGNEVSLDSYQGKTLLFVNVASQCGFTNQYSGLQTMYDELKEQGLEVLGFPCNQFGAQEPGNEEEIKSFCSLKYNVSFPMFSKVDVNGGNASPLYQFLKKEAPGIMGTKDIKWNFTKFLVDKYGNVVKRYAPSDSPEKIAEEVKKHISI